MKFTNTKKLNEEEFEKSVSETFDYLKQLLIVKGKEYRRNGDALHNFNEGAKETGQTRERVLDGMMLKHRISYRDILNDLDEGILPSEALVNEKIGDMFIYLLLQMASIKQTIQVFK